MSKKSSKVWNYFTVEPNDGTRAVCQVNKSGQSCGFRASRGKDRAHFTASGLMSHLKQQQLEKEKVTGCKVKIMMTRTEERL